MMRKSAEKRGSMEIEGVERRDEARWREDDRSPIGDGRPRPRGDPTRSGTGPGWYGEREASITGGTTRYLLRIATAVQPDRGQGPQESR